MCSMPSNVITTLKPERKELEVAVQRIWSYAARAKAAAASGITIHNQSES
jgi:hypothetical protein